MAVTDWDATAANNTTVGGVSIAEGWSPASVNNAIRAVMADVAQGILDDAFADITGKQPLDATLTALAAVATAANKLIYATGADTFATTDITAYGRTLIALADAAALKSSLATIAVTASSIASPGYVSLDLTGNGTADITLQWGTGSIGANTTGTVTFPITFTTFAIPVVSGGSSSAGVEGNVRAYSTGLSSASIVNAGGATASYFWVAVGK